MRWKRYGDPYYVKVPRGTPEERFWAKVLRTTEDGCWSWLARKDKYGYGQFTISNHNETQAHRYAYELLVKPIPGGMTIDHLCRNPGCVNPGHMEIVTNAENVRREWEWRKKQEALRQEVVAACCQT